MKGVKTEEGTSARTGATTNGLVVMREKTEATVTAVISVA